MSASTPVCSSSALMSVALESSEFSEASPNALAAAITGVLTPASPVSTTASSPSRAEASAISSSAEFSASSAFLRLIGM